jgi:hypothetical protein
MFYNGESCVFDKNIHVDFLLGATWTSRMTCSTKPTYWCLLPAYGDCDDDRPSL